MCRNSLVLALLAFVAAARVSPAATSSLSTSVASSSLLAIDGVITDGLVNWSGGDLRGTVKTEPSGSDFPTKTIGSSTTAPLVMHVALPLSKQLVELINEMCSARNTPHTLAITNQNVDGIPVDMFELRDALLTEVTFPALDASTDSVAPVKLVFEGKVGAATKPPSSAVAPGARKKVATFQLEVAGIDSSRAMRVDPITIRRRPTTDTLGEARDYAKTPGITEFSNLLVTMSSTRATSWTAWWTEFVLKGNATDGNEKKGSLALIDAGGTSTALALDFRQLGILRVSRPPGTVGVATALEIEMYFEGLSLSGPASSTTASSALASSAGATDRAGKFGPVGSETPKTIAATELPPPEARTSVITDAAVVTATAPKSAALVGALSPEDVGSRDPAEFPRVEGLIRTYYSGTYQPSYTTEQASYTSTETVDTIVARVHAAAKAAGFTLATMTESGTGSSKSVAERWTKPSVTVGLDFLVPTTGSGTRYELQVYVQLPAEK